ncbi:MAG: hypothetical protein ABSC25_16355 [Roseiarcus sp.]|jgi:hypothetical protein
MTRSDFVSNDPSKIRASFSPAALAGRVSDAFDTLRDRWPRKPDPSEYGTWHSWKYLAELKRVEREQPNRLRPDDGEADALDGETQGEESPSPIVPEPVFSFHPEAPMPHDLLIGSFGVEADEAGGRGLVGMSIYRDARPDRPLRRKRNTDHEKRSRAGVREGSRHDATEFGKLVNDDVACRLILNKEELAIEALDLITRRETDPGLEVFRRGVIAWGKRAEPFPYSAVYFDRKAERLDAEGYQPTPPRTPCRLPGAITGAHAACSEHGLSLDELDAAIEAGSKPIVRRDGVIVALRKAELPKRPKYPPKPAKPASSPVRSLTLVVDNPAPIPAVKLDGEGLLAA